VFVRDMTSRRLNLSSCAFTSNKVSVAHHCVSHSLTQTRRTHNHASRVWLDLRQVEVRLCPGFTSHGES
jgi:hypothetical protein